MDRAYVCTVLQKRLSNSFKRQFKHIAITASKAKLLTFNSFDLKHEKNLGNNQHFFFHILNLVNWMLVIWLENSKFEVTSKKS